MDVITILHEQVHYIPQTAFVAILFFMSFIFVSDNLGQIKTKLIMFFKQIWIVIFLSYAAFLFTVTILARYISKPVFSGVGNFRFIQNGKINREAIFNILLFTPYTFSFLKAFTPKKALRSSFLLAFSSTMFIEVFQFLFWVGHFTIADIVHNVLGGMIGYGIWGILRMYKKSHKHNQTK